MKIVPCPLLDYTVILKNKKKHIQIRFWIPSWIAECCQTIHTSKSEPDNENVYAAIQNNLLHCTQRTKKLH